MSLCQGFLHHGSVRYRSFLLQMSHVSDHVHAKAPRLHLPSGVSAAASLARSRSSLGLRSLLGARSSSKP